MKTWNSSKFFENIADLHKYEITSIALDYHSKFDTSLAGIKNELSDLKKKFRAAQNRFFDH